MTKPNSDGGIGDGSNKEFILEVNKYKQKTSSLT